MPLYEFVCPNCGKKFEKLCRGEVESARCPACRTEAKRILSTFRSTRSSASSCGG